MTQPEAIAAAGLLDAADPPPFELFNAEGAAPLVFVCDHAGRAIPRALGRLGLDEATLARHIAWDIGVADLTRALARRLDAPAVLATYSRLVIDCNRRLDDPTSIPAMSDQVPIPANQSLAAEARRQRAEACFLPYHRQVDILLDSFLARGLAAAFLSMHSFTPVFQGFERPWHVGVLWDRDPRLAVPLLQALAEGGDLVVGDNQPYSGRERRGYAIHEHAEARGLPHALIEVRQDLIDTRPGVAEWEGRLGRALARALSLPVLYGRVE
jgi:predicted N-formylglutamate amidohydrolase